VTGMRRYFNGMTLMLVLFSGLLAGLLYWQSQQQLTLGEATPEDLSVEMRTKENAKESPLQPFIALPLNSFREITERPLFAEGRLPPEKPAEEVAAKIPVTPLRLSLEGVVITPQSRVAVITDLQTNEVLRLAVGMSHSDWKVAKVEQDAVTILRGKEETILALQPDEEPAASNAPNPRFPFRLPKRRPPSPIIPGR
jgi:hypothetical protein